MLVMHSLRYSVKSYAFVSPESLVTATDKTQNHCLQQKTYYHLYTSNRMHVIYDVAVQTLYSIKISYDTVYNKSLLDFFPMNLP